MMDNCGIYMFYSELDSRVYIGSSKNLKRRLFRHKSELKNNKHHNIHLQRFINKHGLNCLKTKIITYCREEELVDLEIKNIKYYNSLEKGFNIAYPDNTKRHFTKEEREKIAEQVKYNQYNKKINVIKEDKIIFTGVICDIVTKFGVDKSSVYKILKGKRKQHKKLTFTLNGSL